MTLESYRKFQFQRFNFLFVEAGHVQAHGRWKRTKRPRFVAAESEDAEAEIFITFKWNQYMFIVKHTVETKATPMQIWSIWQDVENWKAWDQEIELSRLDGPFQTGTTGCTKFVGTPLFKTLLTQVEPYKLVVQEAHLFFAKVISYQFMRQADGKTEVTFQVEIRGLLSLFYACMLCRFIKKKIPVEMEEMLKRVKTLGYCI